MNLELGTDITTITRITKIATKFGMGFFERFLLPNEILLAYKEKESLQKALQDKDSMHGMQDSLLSHTYTQHATNSLVKEKMQNCVPTHCYIPHTPHFFTQVNADAYATQVQHVLSDLKHNFLLSTYRMETIAGFWAIKEACAKALGVGIGTALGFHDMCIFKDIHGKPHLALHEHKWQFFKTQKITISMSHDSYIAVAVCAIVFE